MYIAPGTPLLTPRPGRRCPSVFTCVGGGVSLIGTKLFNFIGTCTRGAKQCVLNLFDSSAHFSQSAPATALVLKYGGVISWWILIADIREIPQETKYFVASLLALGVNFAEIIGGFLLSNSPLAQNTVQALRTLMNTSIFSAATLLRFESEFWPTLADGPLGNTVNISILVFSGLLGVFNAYSKNPYVTAAASSLALASFVSGMCTLESMYTSRSSARAMDLKLKQTWGILASQLAYLLNYGILKIKGKLDLLNKLTDLLFVLNMINKIIIDSGEIKIDFDESKNPTSFTAFFVSLGIDFFQVVFYYSLKQEKFFFKLFERPTQTSSPDSYRSLPT